MNYRTIVLAASAFALSPHLAAEATAAVRDDARDRPIAGATTDGASIRFAQAHEPQYTHQSQHKPQSQGGTGAVSSAIAGKQGSSGSGPTGAADSAVRNWVGFRGGKQAASR